MEEPLPGANVPKDWIGQPVLVLSQTTGPVMLPEGAPLVGHVYSGELRAVNGFGVSLQLSGREKEEGAFYPGGDTFFPWNCVVRISLASPPEP